MPNQPFDLAAAALAEMLRRGFHPDFPPGTREQIEQVRAAALPAAAPELRDLRTLLWSSVDNDTSRDLDQIEWAERTPAGVRVLVAVADVSRSVARESPIDRHAADQTRTIYTAARNFPMLPNELSTDLTSLNEGQDRAAMVMEFTVAPDGTLAARQIYPALVRNRAKLAYSRVGPWLEQGDDTDPRIAGWPELGAQLRLQDEAAHAIRAGRLRQGALDFRRVESDPVLCDGRICGITSALHNRATELIEDFMIAANETMAAELGAAGRSCLRRVVRSPERWERIVALAEAHGVRLPGEPDAAGLSAFLDRERRSDPVRYPDLALAVIKLMGSGEYVVSRGGDPNAPGHFALAVRDYTHSTAPNRRFADLVNQRLVKAMLAGAEPPYSDAELEEIAARCNDREAAGQKVERAMRKRVAAVALAGSVGKSFAGVVTGSGDTGVYVRILEPPVEGRIIRGERGLEVGDSIRVTLLRTDPERAFIDFAAG